MREHGIYRKNAFEEHIEQFFFVISSENCYEISQGRIYGYCIVNGKLLRDCNIDVSDNISVDTPGMFVAILKDSDTIRIIQDGVSLVQLYLYQKDSYWAVSNSFWKLCDEVTKQHSLTLDEIYCEQFFSSGVSPLTLERTLSNEIKLLSPRTEIEIRYGTIRLISRIEKLANKLPVQSAAAMESIDK